MMGLSDPDLVVKTLSTVMSFHSRFLPEPKTLAVSIYLSELSLGSFSWVCRNRLSVARLGMSDVSAPVIKTESFQAVVRYV